MHMCNMYINVDVDADVDVLGVTYVDVYLSEDEYMFGMRPL